LKDEAIIRKPVIGHLHRPDRGSVWIKKGAKEMKFTKTIDRLAEDFAEIRGQFNRITEVLETATDLQKKMWQFCCDLYLLLMDIEKHEREDDEDEED
jgi:hypothetical protein